MWRARCFQLGRSNGTEPLHSFLWEERVEAAHSDHGKALREKSSLEWAAMSQGQRESPWQHHFKLALRDTDWLQGAPDSVGSVGKVLLC